MLMKGVKNFRKNLRLAVEKEFCPAMNSLALYYEARRKFTEMEKYFMMAIQKGNYDKLDLLARHYANRVNDNLKALKLYELDSSAYQSQIAMLKEKMSFPENVVQA